MLQGSGISAILGVLERLFESPAQNGGLRIRWGRSCSSDLIPIREIYMPRGSRKQIKFLQ